MARRTARGARRRPRRRRPRGAKSALHQHTERAVAELSGKRPLRDASVHEVRKELKRARSTLRLLRDAIGDTVYQRANQRLRNAARPLSRVRDAKVLLEAVAKLRDRTKKASHRAELDSLEQRLRRERQRARNTLLQRPARLRRIRSSIKSVLSDSRSWRAPTDESLRRAIKRIYRKGSKAFARTDQDASEEVLHESRKQTKYLGQALKVLAPPRRDGIAKRVKCAESIADALGEDHDLAMLQEKLTARSRSGSSRQELLTLIERRRAKLQQEAAKQSRRLYRHKAKAFVDAVDLHA